MALTPEQQQQVELEIAMTTARMEAETSREAQRNRFELTRIAKEVLIENARIKPADSRDVSAADIVAFATALNNFVNK
jgi:hypothetical protein